MIDALAFGSDTPRSWRQYWTRSVAKLAASALNGTGPLATEIVQAINPVSRIDTKHGPFYCKAGHGRLVWRAETFHTEEPDTVAWLDSIGPEDVLWDVGANVGLYSIYADKFRGCKVIAFEPESQNFALLVENVALNKSKALASNAALTDHCAFGKLHVRYITKGGAFNTFGEGITESARRVGRNDGIVQVSCGVTADSLVTSGFDSPTHMKIDVDGIEPKIIDGSRSLLQSRRLRSVLIELNIESARDREVPDILSSHGFRKVAYGAGVKSTKRLSPMRNMVFER